MYAMMYAVKISAAMATACELCAQCWPWVRAPGIMPALGVGEGEAEPQPVASRRQPSTAAMKTHLVAIYTGRGNPAPQGMGR